MANPFTSTSGSASIGSSEYFLASGSTTATYQTTACKLSGFIDLSNMLAGDQYRIQPYEKVNGGSATPASPAAYPTGTQNGLFKIPPHWVSEGWEIGVKLIAGSARTVSWSLKKDVGDRNLLTWLGSTPAALSTNGYVQSMLKRFLTDDAGGTPNALSSGRVDASVGAMAAGVITATAIAADAIAGAKVAADAVTKIANGMLASALGTSRTVLGVLRRLDWLLVGKAAGLHGTTATFYQYDGTTVGFEAAQDPNAGTRNTASTINGDS